jgi:hypothetical protein
MADIPHLSPCQLLFVLNKKNKIVINVIGKTNQKQTTRKPKNRTSLYP